MEAPFRAAAPKYDDSVSPHRPEDCSNLPPDGGVDVGVLFTRTDFPFDPDCCTSFFVVALLLLLPLLWLLLLIFHQYPWDSLEVQHLPTQVRNTPLSGAPAS